MSTSEIWKDIKGYEGLYQVSNFGRIRSLTRQVENGKGLYVRNGQEMKQAYSSTGYKIVALCKDGKRKMFKVHRLVAIAFIDNPLNKKEVNHIDGNIENNLMENLEWVTHRENIIHAYKTGLVKSVNLNNVNIDKDILINMYTKDGKNISQIASDFNISRDIIRSLLKKYGVYNRGKSGIKRKYDLSHEWVTEQLKYKTAKEIAREVGCCDATISKYRNLKQGDVK